MPRNAPHLITYPDGLGGDLPALRRILEEHFSGVFGGIHVLPPFPSSADRGFAPTSYYEIDPRFGRWTDLYALAEDYELTLDFMVNHISRQSKYFVDYWSLKDDSAYCDLFLPIRKIWPAATVPEKDRSRIYKRKPEDPFLELRFPDGTTELLWCTFSEEQIDLDLRAQKTRQVVRTFLEVLARNGASILRLDAIAYTTKKAGTACFFEEPEIWEFLDYLRGVAEPLGITLLPEVHEHYSYQHKLAEHGYWTYDFALPMLLIHALYRGTSTRVAEWLRRAPRHQFTTLDTHDGIGVVDVVDLLGEEEIHQAKEDLFTHGANVKKRYNKAEYGNLDIYQINCTYYSALGEDDAAYLLARAVQCFAPGIPQVYYVGLLAGTNDVELVERTKLGRNINRHNYGLREIEVALERPVVQRLLALLRFRATHPAFAVSGSMTVETPEPQLLRVRREYEGHLAILEADLASKTFRISKTDAAAPGGSMQELALSLP